MPTELPETGLFLSSERACVGVRARTDCKVERHDDVQELGLRDRHQVVDAALAGGHQHVVVHRIHHHLQSGTWQGAIIAGIQFCEIPLVLRYDPR